MRDTIIASKQQVFAIVRFDDFGDAITQPENGVSVVKVMADIEFANRERDRLAELATSRGSGSTYVVYATRFVEPAQPEAGDDASAG